MISGSVINWGLCTVELNIPNSFPVNEKKGAYNSLFIPCNPFIYRLSKFISYRLRPFTLLYDCTNIVNIATI
ncbi:hypothetical protein ES705_41188 [subsurface metagenome]